jgi:hypothetical protein
VRLLDDHGDLRVAFQPLGEGVDVGLAEAPGERRVVGRGQALVAEHQHLVVEEGGVDGGKAGVVEVGEVEAGDLGAEGAGDRVNRESGAAGLHHVPDTGLILIPRGGRRAFARCAGYGVS